MFLGSRYKYFLNMRSFPSSVSELVRIAWCNSSFMFLLDLLGTAGNQWKVSWKKQKNVQVCHQYQYLRCHEYQYYETL